MKLGTQCLGFFASHATFYTKLSRLIVDCNQTWLTNKKFARTLDLISRKKAKNEREFTRHLCRGCIERRHMVCRETQALPPPRPANRSSPCRWETPLVHHSNSKMNSSSSSSSIFLLSRYIFIILYLLSICFCCCCWKNLKIWIFFIFYSSHKFLQIGLYSYIAASLNMCCWFNENNNKLNLFFGLVLHDISTTSDFSFCLLSTFFTLFYFFLLLILSSYFTIYIRKTNRFPID